MILFSNKYNLFSTISRHKNDLLKEDETKTNDRLLEMNDNYLIDLRSNSSEELQRIELKTLRLKKTKGEYSSSESAPLKLAQLEIDRREYSSPERAPLKL